jgi:hypothetical protein
VFCRIVAVWFVRGRARKLVLLEESFTLRQAGVIFGLRHLYVGKGVNAQYVGFVMRDGVRWWRRHGPRDRQRVDGLLESNSGNSESPKRGSPRYGG